MQKKEEKGKEEVQEVVSAAAKLAAKTANCWGSESNKKALTVLNIASKRKKE